MSGPPRSTPDVASLRRMLASGEGRHQWGDLDDIAAALEGSLGDEFPSFRNAALGTDRRSFLRIMGASLALAGLGGCDVERSQDALPYVVQPEDVTPGRPSYYATAVEFEGRLQPVLATMHRGRPTKLEGNPDHPASLGRSDLFTQAAILDFYDPDRSSLPLQDGKPASWPEFDKLLVERRAHWMRTGGEGLRLLVRDTTSPTLIRQFDALSRTFPQARIHVFEPVGSGNMRDATKLVFGQPLEAQVRLDQAKAIVSIGADILGPGPYQVWNVRHWAQRRGETAGDERLVLHVAESTPSQTGSAADRRLAADPSRLPMLVSALASRVGLMQDGGSDTLSQDERVWTERAADLLKAHRGNSLLLVGEGCPVQAQALALRINQHLGNVGAALTLAEPTMLASSPAMGSLVDLVRDLNDGRVQDLVMIDVDPVYAAPADLGFAEAMKRAPLTIHAGLHVNGTAAASMWHLPLPHPLETWSDGRAVDGTLSITQPLVEPLYASRSRHALIASLAEISTQSARDIVQTTWRERFGADFDRDWTRALHDGFVAQSASQAAALAVPSGLPPAPLPQPVQAARDDHVELQFAPDPTIWDGRFANNAWLQELGKPLIRVTWENVILVSPTLSERLAVSNGDHVRIEREGRAVEGPVWIMPGQAERTVTLFLGYGQRRIGEVGREIGYDAYGVRTSDAPWNATGATITKLAGRTKLASTQPHQKMEGDDFVRVVPGQHRDASRDEDREQASIYPKWPAANPSWGMVIDLDLCTGCNACTVACQAENNVPVVGKEEVSRGRHMHWLRVDKYHAGALDDPATYFQPVPCMHCEEAPCEMGCPVHATIHGPDGLNEQIYNRCIGTRTCSSYCPYKVRRFNWFDYTSGAPESTQAQRNPDVTVRGRGVMEKCTYCVQRIRAAQGDADKEDRAIREGEVQTACQSACPSRAITFGNIADPASGVSAARGSSRNYALLSHLGTRPRTTYLARIAADAPDKDAG